MTAAKDEGFPKHRILSAGKFTETYAEGCRNAQRFCFILGSGASVESGIPMGSTLEYRWMNCLMGEEWDQGTPPMDRSITYEFAEALSDELDHPFSKIVSEWEKAKSEGQNTLPSEYYFDIYKLRFYPDELNGDRYLEGLMESVEPSFGYHTLAQLLTDGHNNNLVITTNFDSLVEDALFLYTRKKPLITNHELAAGFIKEQSIRRPIIAKLHRGLFFKPFNNPSDTNGLCKEWEDMLRQIFQIYIPVVIGYGGGDRSFMKFLLQENKEGQELIPKIYWCYVNKYGLPDKKIQNFIKNRKNGYFVRTDGFDHIMLTMGRRLFFPKISTNATENYLKKRTEERINHYNEQYQKLSEVKDGADEFKSEADEFSKEEEKDRKEREKSSGLTEWDYIREGNSYYNNNEYEKALAAYEKAMKSNPEMEQAYNNRGATYQEMGEYEKALTEYNKALELNPEMEQAYNNRGNTYKEMEEYEKALADYNKALELNPEYVNAYNGRGSTYKAMGEYEKALTDYNKALELNPEYEYAYYNRGNTYQAMGEYKKALTDYNKAVQLNPSDVSNYQRRAEMYRKVGENEKAEADEQRIKELEQK